MTLFRGETAKRLGVAVVLVGVASGCTSTQVATVGQEPEIQPTLPTTKRLKNLPPPETPMTVAVYGFKDRTGQRKPDEKVASLSTAVTQGGAAILTDAAFNAGEGSWFNVLERKGLDHLFRERKIITGTRKKFRNGRKLTPLKFAGVLLEGGIISYDTNRLTGGAGARLLGIGGNTEYRADTVSVYLRASSVKTGKIVQSVDVTKTLYSAKVQGNVFKYIAPEEILEMDAGISVNEPTQVAVRQAIEAAVYALVAEGAIDGLWSFDNARAERKVLNTYRRLKSADPAAGTWEETATTPGA